MIAALLFHLSDPVHPDLADCAGRWKSAMEACDVAALAMVVVENDAVVHRVLLGRRDPESDLTVTEDTRFYIASATKPYVAFALAQLAEQGKVDLDAPVKRYLPRFALADARATETITVRDLLCHRPGLDEGAIVLLDAYTGEITEDRYYHFLGQVEPLGRVAYSNVHFTLAGRVIEAVSGATWRDYLAEHVLAPAGMTRTTGYADRMYADPDVAWPAQFELRRARRAPHKSDRTMHAAGGLGTSIADLSRWLRLQLGRGAIDGKRLLSERATEATWELTSRSKDNDDFGAMDGFALGWQRGTYRGHVELRHGGGYTGAASYVCFLPELGLGLAVVATGDTGANRMCRLVSIDVHERLLADDEIADALPALLEEAGAAHAREAKIHAERAAAPPSAVQLSLAPARYAGSYRNEWFGTLTIEEHDGTLAARLGELALAIATPAADQIVVRSAGVTAGGAFELAGDTVAAVTLDIDGAVRFVR